MPSELYASVLEGGRRLRGFAPQEEEGQPLVSIVTVVLNGEKHLRQTIESVLVQTYPNIEYVVLDGGSTDGTLDIIRSYEDQIDYWRSGKDGGIYAAMNTGVSLCRGDLIGLKNADDWYTPHAVADVVKTWKETQADIIYGNTYVVWQEEPLQTSLFVSDHRRIAKDGGIDHRTIFATRKAYQAYTYDTQYKVSADFDWYLNLQRAGMQFAHTGTVIGYKRPGGFSAGSQTVKDIFAINRKHFGLAYAIRIRIRQILIFTKLWIVNTLLKAALGPEGFARFKARKR